MVQRDAVNRGTVQDFRNAGKFSHAADDALFGSELEEIDGVVQILNDDGDIRHATAEVSSVGRIQGTSDDSLNDILSVSD